MVVCIHFGSLERYQHTKYCEFEIKGESRFSMHTILAVPGKEEFFRIWNIALKLKTTNKRFS